MTDPTIYGRTVAELLYPPRLAALGPGTPNAEFKARLQSFNIETDLGGPIRDRAAAKACLSGLWLYHDFLDESHTICQDLETSEGCFWHAIMHRREPDASNSKYWWRIVGQHPVLEQLRERAPKFGYQYRTPMEFVDFVESVRGKGTANENLARQIQVLEWELLFDWCYRVAK